MRRMKAELSSPILLVALTIIAVIAGLTVAKFAWWVAPQSSKLPMLIVVGEPSLINEDVNGDNTTGADEWALYVTVKNVGTDKISVTGAIIYGVHSDSVTAVNGGDTVVDPGESVELKITFTGLTFNDTCVEGVLLTDGGTFPISAYVVQ